MPPDTLVSLMADKAVSNEELYARHGAAATIVRHLLGVVPHSGGYFELWPPANRICWTIVPNFLNAPFMVFGFGVPKNLVSLAMFASSIGADCAYCVAHACTFSMRRGVQIGKLTLEAVANRHSDDSVFDDVETVVLDVAESLGRVPCTLTAEKRQEFETKLQDPATVEWIVVVIAMMGFLNKAMDALGIPLEVPVYQETRDILGGAWTPRKNGQLLNAETQPATPPPLADWLWTYLKMVVDGPSAAAYERRTVVGVPETGEDAASFLKQRTGYDFPLLKALHHLRVVRAITFVLGESFNVETSVIGLQIKVEIAQVFATVTESNHILDIVRGISSHFDVEQGALQAADVFASELDPIAGAKRLYPGDCERQALMVVAHASSFSPVRVNAEVVSLCRDAQLSSSAMVEVVAWVSVLQMLHRLSMFYFMDVAPHVTK